VQEANDVHRLVLADPAFYWEGASDGCFARALLVVDRMEREGIPQSAIGKVQIVHKEAPMSGWEVQTRLAGMQRWAQHVAATIETMSGRYVIDPTLSDTAEPERQWLERFPLSGLNPAAAPSPHFLQTLLVSSDVAFQGLLALAANRPEFFNHLLNNPAVAARLEQLGNPVLCWLERRGPIAEKFDDHIAGLATAADQAGPVVRGEAVRVTFGCDFFDDVPWDLAGPSVYGHQGAQVYLQRMRLRNFP
jgi:hypothetical protein